MKQSLGIIPARLYSERFPNKLLKDIDGVPILKRSIDNVKEAEVVDDIIVATDSKEIVEFCIKNGYKYFFMTNKVSCGSERAYYVYKEYPNYYWYITFPADEPFIHPNEIKKAYKKNLETPFNMKNIDYIRTCWSKFYSLERLKSVKSCKIISRNNEVLYFSRAIIPASKAGDIDILNYKKHVGIFFIHCDLFRKIKTEGKTSIDIWESNLSKIEGLEQNAFIENGLNVKLIEINHKYYGVDTPDDITKLEELI